MKPAIEYLTRERLMTISKERVVEIMKEYASTVLDELEDNLINTGHLTDGVKIWIGLTKQQMD